MYGAPHGKERSWAVLERLKDTASDIYQVVYPLPVSEINKLSATSVVVEIVIVSRPLRIPTLVDITFLARSNVLEPTDASNVS